MKSFAESEALLASFFKVIAEYELRVEIARQVLADQPDFVPHFTFRALDPRNRGYVTVDDMFNYLLDIGSICNKRQIILIFKSLGRNSEITYSGFAALVLPRANPMLQSICNRRIPPVRVSHNVRYCLMLLIEREIEFIRKIEDHRFRLSLRHDFDEFDYFNAIDRLRIGAINGLQLKEFMTKNGYQLNQREVDAIFNRWAQDNDSRLTFNDFRLALTVLDNDLRVKKPSSYVSSPRYYSPIKTSGRLSYVTPNSKPLRSSPTTRSTRYSEKYSSPESLQMTDFVTPPKSVQRKLRFDSSISSLTDVFKEQLELDKRLNASLEKLSLQSDFIPTQVFSLFDKTSSDCLTITDLEETANELGLKPLRSELILLMRHYDCDVDGQLKFADFARMFTPNKDAYKSLVTTRAESSVQISQSTKALLAEALKSHFEAEVEAESIRTRLSNCDAVSLHKLFSEIDINRDGYLTKEELEETLKSHDVEASRNEIEGLINRYDKDGDGRISYLEFVQEVTPKSPSY